MSFEKFEVRVSAINVLPLENIDTDQIIPARFLKTTTREGFGDNLFYDWRYNSDGSKNESFVINSVDNGAKFLVAGRNFGCGSSREHAAWALYDYGFRAVISSFFADIFRNNALNNGLLPVQVSDEFLSKIFSEADSDINAQIEINLKERSVKILSTGEYELFPIDDYKQSCLINGYDDIDFLCALKNKVEDFENRR